VAFRPLTLLGRPERTRLRAARAFTDSSDGLRSESMSIVEMRRVVSRCAALGEVVEGYGSGDFGALPAGAGPEVAVLEPVGIAFEAEDLGVVDQPVDHRGGGHVVAEDLAPRAEGLVAGDDQASAFIAAGDEHEHQACGLGVKRDVSHLIDLCGYPHRSICADTATMPTSSPTPGRTWRAS